MVNPKRASHFVICNHIGEIGGHYVRCNCQAHKGKYHMISFICESNKNTICGFIDIKKKYTGRSKG